MRAQGLSLETQCSPPNVPTVCSLLSLVALERHWNPESAWEEHEPLDKVLIFQVWSTARESAFLQASRVIPRQRGLRPPLEKHWLRHHCTGGWFLIFKAILQWRLCRNHVFFCTLFFTHLLKSRIMESEDSSCFVVLAKLSLQGIWIIEH